MKSTCFGIMLLLAVSAVSANQKPQHSRSDKNKGKILQWQMEIKELIKERQECVAAKQKKIDELEKKIKEAQKACGNGKPNKIHVGSPRLLGKGKNDDNSEDDSAAENSNDNNSNQNSQSDEDSNESNHNNHGKGGKGGNGSAWGKKEQSSAKINAVSNGKSFGKGGSMSMAGPQGAHSQAKGAHGTQTGSSFNSDEENAFDNWGVSKNGGKGDAWGSKGKSNQKVKSNVMAKTYGKGESGTQTGRNGAQAFGNGDFGSATGADWKGNVDNREESFGVKKHK